MLLNIILDPFPCELLIDLPVGLKDSWMTGDKAKFDVNVQGRISLTNELRCDNTYWVQGMMHNLLMVA